MTKSVHVNPRSHARDFAVQFLYQCECERVYFYPEAQMSAFINHFAVPDHVSPFLKSLVRGTLQNMAEIDKTISELSSHWSVERMSVTDRSILRLAHYELHHEDTPPKVIINEAIDLAKKYGSESSGSFVNGLLDQLMKRLHESHASS